MATQKDIRQSIKVAPEVYKDFMRLVGLTQAKRGESLSHEAVIAPIIRRELERMSAGRRA